MTKTVRVCKKFKIPVLHFSSKYNYAEIGKTKGEGKLFSARSFSSTHLGEFTGIRDYQSKNLDQFSKNRVISYHSEFESICWDNFVQGGHQKCER